VGSPNGATPFTQRAIFWLYFYRAPTWGTDVLEGDQRWGHPELVTLARLSPPCCWLRSERRFSHGAAAPAAQSEEAQANELKLAWVAGTLAALRGPADIALIDQATLKLPPGYDFISQAEGARIPAALGNTVGELTFVGLIVGTKPGDDWIVATRYVKEGISKDDDAKNWNADELLANIKEGTRRRIRIALPAASQSWKSSAGWRSQPMIPRRIVLSGRCSPAEGMSRIRRQRHQLQHLRARSRRLFQASIC